MERTLTALALCSLAACGAAPDAPSLDAPRPRVATSGRRLPADCTKSRFNCRMDRATVAGGPHPDPDDANRAAGSPRDPKDPHWHIARAEPVAALDGRGVQVGSTTWKSVKVNYGDRKRLRNAEGTVEDHVFGFAFGAQGGEKMSAWLPLSAFDPADAAVLAKMPDVSIRGLADASDRPTQRSYVLAGATSAERRRYRVNGTYCSIADEGVGRKSAADYLDDDFGLVDLVYRVPATGGGGQARDTFRIGKDVVFHRSHEPTVRPRAPNERCRRMRFVFGRVDDGLGAGRWGWLPYDVLEVKR